MADFVKLTGTKGETFGVRKTSVVGIQQATRVDVSVVYIGDMADDHVCYVTETPEQIMALIDGSTDQGALVEAMGADNGR